MKRENAAVFSRKSDNWGTPQYLFDQLNEEFHFTLDACASEENKKCQRYFSVENNGLEKDWSEEIVFCNPPYSEVKKWVEKAYQESSENGATVILLIPSRTDTKWFHEYIWGKAEIRFIKGRLRFGNATENAPFPSMIVVYRGKEKCTNQAHDSD